MEPFCGEVAILPALGEPTRVLRLSPSPNRLRQNCTFERTEKKFSRLHNDFGEVRKILQEHVARQRKPKAGARLAILLTPVGSGSL